MLLGTKTGERGRETRFAENGKYLNLGYQTYSVKKNVDGFQQMMMKKKKNICSVACFAQSRI